MPGHDEELYGDDMPTADDHILVHTAGEPAMLFLGQERVELDRLGRRLEAIRGDYAEGGGRVAVLRVHESVPVSIERQVAEITLRKGFRVMLAGRYSPGGVEDRVPEAESGDAQ